MTEAKRCDLTGEYWDVVEEEETKEFLIARQGENEGEVEILDVHPKIYNKILRILSRQSARKKRKYTKRKKKDPAQEQEEITQPEIKKRRGRPPMSNSKKDNEYMQKLRKDEE